MKQIQLKDTDITFGSIVFGAMTFGSQVDERGAEQMVDRCRAAGITMFDCSNNYNDGLAEEVLGRAVRGFRDEVQLTTKVGSSVGLANKEFHGLSRKAIVGSLDASLRRLGTEYVDVYYFHRPDNETPIEESLAAADEVVRAGKARVVAQSNFAAWQITEAYYLSAHHGWPELTLSQPMYNLLSRRIEAEYASCSDRLGLTNIVYNPLAGGLLTGKHTYEADPDPGTRFANPVYRQRYWHPELFSAVDRLRALADDLAISLIELSFRWLLSRPLVDGILIGASSLSQLDSNMAAIKRGRLDEQTLAACDEVWADLHGPVPLYNR
jgi:aryl-alcohol dehydrogenase-like predicted oxidoreductase